MRIPSWFLCLLIPLSLIHSTACGGGGDPITPPDTTGTDTIPLDGRGGGVLAYTLQGGAIHEIHAMNADGTGSRRLITSPVGLNHHDWSPDALQFAAVGYYGDTWSVHTFSADGQNLTRLTNTLGVWDNEPTWSPDGSTILFTRIYPAENHRTEIWMMNADGTEQRWIGVEGFVARWSPDGIRLIYQSSLVEYSGAQSDIMTCAADGSDVQAVTQTPSSEIAPIWSPDGSQIAFIADYDGDYDLYVMNADGSNTRRLTDNDVEDYSPRWSPDGTMIAFSSDTSGAGHWEVHVIGADGTGLRRVTHTPPPRTSINAVWRPTN